MIKYLIMLLTGIVFTLLSCTRIYHKSSLSLLQQPFTPDSITFRTDGYYYTEIEYEQYTDAPPGKKNSLFKAKGFTPIIFYNDGYVNKVESMWLENKPSDSASKKRIIDSLLTNYEKSYIQYKYPGKRKSKVNIWDWGIYRQTGSDLELQYYSNHFGMYRLITLKAKILNDTTFLAFHKFSPLVGMMPHIINDSINEIYKFRKFSPKPDSTNYLRDNLYKFGKKKK